MSISVVEIGAYVSAALLSASRLLTVAKPLWAKLPRVVAVAIPVVVAALPVLAEQAGLITTPIDLTTFFVAAAALLVPGISEAEKVK